MHISRRKPVKSPFAGVPRGLSSGSDSLAGAMVRLAGVSRSAKGNGYHKHRIQTLASPTGLEGLCKNSWVVPFKGFVSAA